MNPTKEKRSYRPLSGFFPDKQLSTEHIHKICHSTAPATASADIVTFVKNYRRTQKPAILSCISAGCPKPTIMKKFLLPFLLLSGSLSAQGFAVSNFTTSMAVAPNCFIDSSKVFGNGVLNQRIDYTYDNSRRLLKTDRNDTQTNQREIHSYLYDANDSVVQKTHAGGISVTTSTMMTRMTRNQQKLVVHDTVSYNTGAQYTLNAAATYSYDAAGLVTEITRSSYNGTWSLLNRLQITRNAAGKPTSELFMGWVNNAWANSSIKTTTYNSNGDFTDQEIQTWNTASSAWKNSSRSRVVYTGTHVDTFVVYTWNNAWVNFHRYTYSPAGAVDTVTIDYWDGQQWDGFNRYVRTWDQGRLTSVTEQKLISSWENAWKHEYLYDGKGNNTVTNIYAYNSPADPWVKIIVTDHHYTCFSTAGVAENSAGKATSYPVPTSGHLYFSTASPVKQGTVYGIKGELILGFEGSAVDLSQTGSGIYFVQLQLLDGSTSVVKAVRE